MSPAGRQAAFAAAHSFSEVPVTRIIGGLAFTSLTKLKNPDGSHCGSCAWKYSTFFHRA
jgi:hypothetical protein